MKQIFRQLSEGKRDLLLVFGVVTILVILFTPIPPGLLDFLLIVNVSLALTILILTFYTDKPLSFSTFPSMLLIATLFRLSLNIASTRLILDGANAGQVIAGIGNYVVGGNYVIGLVVFLILVIVQYIVVTNGAQRVAEVAARFTLDSMPGKQMSIDADLNMGIIDENEARQRRAMIEKEASFYGAMDGATKFVKGDAVAGILIVLINIIGGLSVGIAQAGMSWTEALHTYTLLTVGDGIVTQIPSLVIATATGIIITRAATDAHLGEEISRQVMGHPKSMLIVAVVLTGLLFMPGLPALPIVLVLSIFAAATVLALRATPDDAQADATAGGDTHASGLEVKENLYHAMKLHALEIRAGASVLALIESSNGALSERLQAFRKQFALEMGFVIPQVRVSGDNALDPDKYVVRIQESTVAKGEVRADRLLAIRSDKVQSELEGEDTTEPTYGLPAKWIPREQRQLARSAGYTLVDAETVILTHFSEVVRQHAADILSRSETERLVERTREYNSALLDELVPAVLSYSDIQKVLQQLLREKVSVRNIDAVLEVLVDKGKAVKGSEELTEYVRERLGSAICQALADKEGTLSVLTLAPELERQLLTASRQRDAGATLFDDGEQIGRFISRLSEQAEQMMRAGVLPVLLCPGSIRRQLRNLVLRALPHVSILGASEIPSNARVRSFGVIGLEQTREKIAS